MNFLSVTVSLSMLLPILSLVRAMGQGDMVDEGEYQEVEVEKHLTVKETEHNQTEYTKEDLEKMNSDNERYFSDLEDIRFLGKTIPPAPPSLVIKVVTAFHVLTKLNRFEDGQKVLWNYFRQPNSVLGSHPLDMMYYQLSKPQPNHNST